MSVQWGGYEQSGHLATLKISAPFMILDECREGWNHANLAPFMIILGEHREDCVEELFHKKKNEK
jgi:hypothetical protein